MNKSIILIMIFCFVFVSSEKAQTSEIELKIKHVGSIIKFKFINKTNNIIQIPSLSLRNIIEKEYVVLSPKYIIKHADTLIIDLTKVVDSAENKLLIIPIPSDGAKVSLNYASANLKRKSIQKIRLPEKYRGEVFKYGKVFLDEKLIAKAKIE